MKRVHARVTLIPLVATAVAAFAAFPRDARAQSGLVSRSFVVFDSRWNDEAFAEIAAGGDRTIAGRSDGTFVMWGGNYYAECQVAPLPAGLRYVQVATGGIVSEVPQLQIAGHTLGLRSDGSIAAWGSNLRGQCDVPPLPGELKYVEIAAGQVHSLARRSDGSVVAWGGNDDGQCDVPPLPGELEYVAVTAGFGHSAALRSNGSIVAWGDNSQTQCNVPVPPAENPYVEVSAGDYHTVARRSDGSVVAWGANLFGQCNVPIFPAGHRCVEIAAGARHTLARLDDGRILAWGQVAHGQCDVPALTGGLTYVQVAAGARHSVARRSDGRVVAWGNSEWSQLNVPALPGGLAYVDYCGWSLALRSDGSLVSWGVQGDLVPDLPTGIKYVAASRRWHTLALRSDGSLVAWGSNAYGQCDIPPLPSGLTYTQAAASLGCSLAVRSDGSVVVWGDDEWGQHVVPPLPAGVGYVEVDSNGEWWGWPDEFCLARRSDGEVVAWGNCFWGQCSVPALPPGVTYVQIAAGAFHAIARRSDGEVVAWGNNEDGQCEVPPLPSGVTYVDIAAGSYHGAALRSDGEVVAWGSWFSRGSRYLPTLPTDLAYVGVEGDGVGQFVGCPTCYPPFCSGDRGPESVVCPCRNFGEPGRGCDNSASTGGARLTVDGSVDPDRVVLGATEMIPSSLCIFLQGRTVLGTPIPFGDGVRCIGGTLVRLGVRSANSGSSRFPGIGDPSISARSETLGDFIRPGTYRYYQAFYRDSQSGFCSPSPATFNASNAVMVRW